MKKITLIFLVLFFCQTKGQTINSFQIDQVGLPSGEFISYKYDGKELLIEKGSKKRLQRIKLNEKQISSLDSLLYKLGLDTLEENYYTRAFDGVKRDFDFNLNGKNINIHLSNYYLYNLDLLLSFINQYIKPKNRLISFGDEVYLKSDTAYYVYPDFFLWVQKPDSNYFNPSIQCFKKRRLIVEVLDSAVYCQCVVYALHGKRHQYPRLDPWKAIKKGNYLWEFQYFNPDKTLLKKEVRQGRTPLVFKKEKIIKTPGDRPSIHVYQYYETQIID